jgi:hypothetical protein
VHGHLALKLESCLACFGGSLPRRGTTTSLNALPCAPLDPNLRAASLTAYLALGK